VRIPLVISTLVARAVGTASRRSGKGGGTTLPGRVLNVLNPEGMARLAARLEQGSAIISATNGKTTTAAMTAAILAPRFRLAGNPAGANLSSGISTALLYARGADLGLFEVDEAALPQVTEALKPRVLCLGNLFRDQLDRYGELELLAERWRGVVSGLPADNTLAVNEDDPQLAQLARGRESVIRFGIEDERHGGPLPHAADARYCSACGAAYSYELAYVGHLGKYSCSGCGFERMRPNIWAEEIELAGLTGSTFRLRLPERTVTVRLGLPGVYNIYNALAAATVGYALGARAEEIASGLESTQAAFGRSERIAVGEQKLLLLLIKNPTGANEVVRTLVADGTPKTLVIALNDEIADGQDTSWIWDVDFEPLLGGLERLIASGGRAAELALRFKYAGFPEARIEVVPSPAEALDRGLELMGEKGELIVCPTYTAMLELQDVLVARGHADPYWQRAARAREESGEARKPR